jgi:hypothetical protein
MNISRSLYCTLAVCQPACDLKFVSTLFQEIFVYFDGIVIFDFEGKDLSFRTCHDDLSI